MYSGMTNEEFGLRNHNDNHKRITWAILWKTNTKIFYKWITDTNNKRCIM